MKKVIKGFSKFPESSQEEIYALYQEGELARATFPFQGEIADGLIFDDEAEEITYLIPVSTIKASKFSSADDDDDDDNDDADPDDDIDVGEDAEDAEDAGDEE